MANVITPLSGKAYVQSAYPGDPIIDYSPDYMRRVLGAIWRIDGTITAYDMLLTQRAAGANWSVDITPGSIIIPGIPTTEKYMVSIPETLNIPLTGLNLAPAATRYHAVYVAVYDRNYSGTEYGAKVVITEDVGSGAPTPPNTNIFQLIAHISISPAQPSVQNSHITNLVNVAGPATATAQNWLKLDPATGIVYWSGGISRPEYNRVGNTVRMRGMFARTSSAKFLKGNTTLVSNLPDFIRPVRPVYLPCTIQYGTDGDPVNARIYLAGGDMVVHIQDGSDTLWVCLDGIIYDTNA